MSKTQQLLDSLNSLKNSNEQQSASQSLTGKLSPVESNFIDEKYIDRLYGGYNQMPRLIQADGSVYTGKIYKKSRPRPRIDGSGNFKQTIYVTADNRWFDNSGMPIEKPNTVDDEVENNDTTTD